MITRRWSIRPIEAPSGKTVVGQIVPQASELTHFDTVRRRKAVRRAAKQQQFVEQQAKPLDTFNGLGV